VRDGNTIAIHSWYVDHAAFVCAERAPMGNAVKEFLPAEIGVSTIWRL